MIYRHQNQQCIHCHQNYQNILHCQRVANFHMHDVNSTLCLNPSPLRDF